MSNHTSNKFKDNSNPIIDNLKSQNTTSKVIKNNDVITIAEARRKSPDTKVKIHGIVTCEGFTVFIQDNTAGINLYKQSSGDSFHEGDLIQVTGIIKKRDEMIIIRKYSVKKISSGNPLPVPHNKTIQQIVNDPINKYEAQLVKIKNVKIQHSSYSLMPKIVDNKGNKLYLFGNIDSTNINNGDYIDITAIIYVDKTPKLYVKSKGDLVKLHSSISVKFTPGNMTSLFNKTPKICASFKVPNEFLDFSTAKLYIDGTKVSHVINKNCLYHTPLNDLSYGQHYIKVSICDKNNGSHEFQWYFIVENKNIKYNFYYGVPHSHTSYSDGKGTPTEAYEHARNMGLDFLIITDHLGRLFNSEIDWDNQILKDGKMYSKWQMISIESDAINKKYNDFLALIGFEIRTKIWGHLNVINSKNIINKKRGKLIEELYDWLKTQYNIVVSLNHPSRSSKTLPTLTKMNRLMNLVEVGNGSTPHKYKRSEDCYFKILDNGCHAAPINGQDNHLNNWGDCDNLTVVIAENLNITSFISAMKLRRIYSTETRTLKLAVKGNNHWMGSILEMNKGDKLNFDIIAEDISVPIKKLQLISNGGRVLEEKEFQNSHKAQWTPSITITSEPSWYVVKVIHSDDRWGFASPIFVQLS